MRGNGIEKSTKTETFPLVCTNQKKGEKPMRHYLEGVVFGVICILLIKSLLSI